MRISASDSECPIHGRPSKRQSCRLCNAAYMRVYMRQRRLESPAKAILERARRRADQKDLPFDLTIDDIIIPERCPALGTPFEVGERRSGRSPSLDRIVPYLGYVRGNVRVISDRANRLKGDRSPAALRQLSEHGEPEFRSDYEKIAIYVERETLLTQARIRAGESRRAAEEWDKIADFLEKLVHPIA